MSSLNRRLDLGQPTAGLVNMRVTGNLMTVIVHIHGEANATYYSFLFATNSGYCPGTPPAGTLNPVTTNSSGVANERETFLVPGGGSYYVLAYSADGSSFLGTTAFTP